MDVFRICWLCFIEHSYQFFPFHCWYKFFWFLSNIQRAFFELLITKEIILLSFFRHLSYIWPFIFLSIAFHFSISIDHIFGQQILRLLGLLLSCNFVANNWLLSSSFVPANHCFHKLKLFVKRNHHSTRYFVAVLKFL